ncbi:MAG: UMP kinase, partial [Candidatus Izemoplasmatales bacterium]|nr:UMP kinase [Candidatus Izemoplasmatales bacterium]
MSKRRIMIKLSGEALAGKAGVGIDPKVVKTIAREIKSAYDLNLCEIGLVVGGGNIFRGKLGDEMGIDRSSADYMGMISTILNALALQNSLESMGVPTRVMTSLNIPEVAEP